MITKYDPGGEPVATDDEATAIVSELRDDLERRRRLLMRRDLATSATVFGGDDIPLVVLVEDEAPKVQL